MTFIGRYNTHYVMLMDTVTACKSGFDSVSLYSPCLGVEKVTCRGNEHRPACKEDNKTGNHASHQSIRNRT